MQQEILDMSKSLEYSRTCITNNERKCRESQARMDLLTKIEKDCLKNVQLLQSAVGDMMRVKDSKEKVKTISQKNDEAAKMLKDLETDKLRLEKLIEASQEKLSRQGKQKEMNSALVKEQLDRLLSETQVVEQENYVKLNEIEQCHKAISKIRADMQSSQVAFEQEEKVLTDAYTRLNSTIAKYHNSMLSLIVPLQSAPLSAILPQNVEV